MKCPYCEHENNDFITLNQTAEYSGIEIAMNRQGMLRVRCCGENTETFQTQDIVEIKYCPLCGKKIEKF
jgi:hypothetical protein